MRLPDPIEPLVHADGHQANIAPLNRGLADELCYRLLGRACPADFIDVGVIHDGKSEVLTGGLKCGSVGPSDCKPLVRSGSRQEESVLRDFLEPPVAWGMKLGQVL